MENRINIKNTQCIKYDTTILEYLFPLSGLFKSFCESEDKTELFLVSFIRSFIWLYVLNTYFTYVYELTDKTYFNIVKSDKILILLLIMCLINIIYLIAVMFKKPVHRLYQPI